MKFVVLCFLALALTLVGADHVPTRTEVALEAMEDVNQWFVRPTFAKMGAFAALAPYVSEYADDNYIGEDMSLLEHSLQTATLIAKYRSDPAMILAGFFHDIGHLVGLLYGKKQMDGLGTLEHAAIGANYLEELGWQYLADIENENMKARFPKDYELF